MEPPSLPERGFERAYFTSSRGRSAPTLEPLILEIVRAAGIEVASLASLSPSVALFEHALSEIARADLLVADLGGSSPNPAYEVGLATGLGKQVLALTDRPDQLSPYVLGRYPVVTYSFPSQDVSDLANRIKQALSSLTDRSLPTATEYAVAPPSESLLIEMRARDGLSAAKLRFAADVLEIFEQVGESPNLERVRTGSWLGWIRVGPSAARAGKHLLDRFSTKELREAKAEKARAEGKKATAEAELARAQAEEIRRQGQISEAGATLDAVERLVRLAKEDESVGPVSIIVGGAAKIERSAGGQISIGPPDPSELGVPPERQLPR